MLTWQEIECTVGCETFDLVKQVVVHIKTSGVKVTIIIRHKLAKVEAMIRGAYGQVMGAIVHRTTTLRHPVNRLYLLEISCSEDLDAREEAPNTAHEIGRYSIH